MRNLESNLLARDAFNFRLWYVRSARALSLPTRASRSHGNGSAPQAIICLFDRFRAQCVLSMTISVLRPPRRTASGVAIVRLHNRRAARCRDLLHHQ